MSGVFSALVELMGIRSVVALMGGGVSVLLGVIGFGLLRLGGQPASGRGWFRQGLLLFVSAVFLVGGGLTILFTNIIFPIYKYNRVLNRIVLLQSEQVTLDILSQPRNRDPKRLNRHEYKVYSQNGEDGILAEIFRRIGTTNRSFVEFGASDGLENNTAFLLRQGWKGLWMDADTAAVERARSGFRQEIADQRLIVLETFITAENIEDLFRQGKVPEEFDLLVIDIDRNDYHVWEKIAHYRPRVVTIEYNSGIPPTMSWVVPYDPKAFGWTGFGTGNGASLKALEELGTRKGYSLVGCDLCGVNAFFVRNDLLDDRFAAPYTAENHYEPFRILYISLHQYEGNTLSRKPGKDGE
jgi:hypothetical protein